MKENRFRKIHKASAIIHFIEGTVLIPESTVYLPTAYQNKIVKDLNRS